MEHSAMDMQQSLSKFGWNIKPMLYCTDRV